MDTKNHKNKGLRKCLNLIFKQGTKNNYMIQKKNIRIKNKNTKYAKQM
jgi:hypothetical protein